MLMEGRSAASDILKSRMKGGAIYGLDHEVTIQYVLCSMGAKLILFLCSERLESGYSDSVRVVCYSYPVFHSTSALHLLEMSRLLLCAPRGKFK
jgi:hypothetical protein